jgi:amino acid transporter
MIPKTGGAYVWAKPALGNCVGFFTGWFSWFAQTIACAFYATAFGSFFLSLLNTLGVLNLDNDHWIGQIGFGILISLILLGVNLKGSKNINFIQLIVTAIQIVIIFIFAAYGLHTMFGEPQESISHFDPFFPQGAVGVLAAMGLTFIAFEGYEIIVQSSEEVRNPTKTIPKAIFTSIIAVVVLYVIVAMVMLGGIETENDMPIYKYLGNLGELGLIETAAQLMPNGKLILLFAALASTASALNATIYGSTRIALAMARSSDLPSYLSKVSSKTFTPINSIWTTGAIMCAIIILLPIKDIAASTDIMFILVFMSVAASLIAFRKSRPEAQRPFKVPFSPVLPGLVIVSGIALCVSLYHISISAWIAAFSWSALGIITYLGKSRLFTREENKN